VSPVRFNRPLRWRSTRDSAPRTHTREKPRRSGGRMFVRAKIRRLLAQRVNA
jgi:hypothetical protein